MFCFEGVADDSIGNSISVSHTQSRIHQPNLTSLIIYSHIGQKQVIS